MRVSSQLHALDERLNEPKRSFEYFGGGRSLLVLPESYPALRIITKPAELSGLRTFVLVLKIMLKVVFVKFWRNFTIHDGFYSF
jgi:hypothetical protein